MQIRERNLGGRYEVIVALESQLEQIGLEFRELSSAEERIRIDDDRRQHLQVAVFLRVEVEHEVDQRAFELRAKSAEDGEARARHLRRALLVEDAQSGAEVDVVLRLEAFGVEIARSSPAADFPVGRLVGADRNRLVRQVWN